MFSLQKFENPSFGSIRVIEKDGETWFVAKDITEILEYADTYSLTRRLDKEDMDKWTVPTDSVGTIKSISAPPLTIINESGFYDSIFCSVKKEAKAFKKWVTSEVLPSVRKHGFYGTPQTLEKMVADPDFAIGLLQELKKEQLATKQAKIERDKAIRTKAQISDKKTATAMATASAAVRRADKLALELEEHREYASCIKVARALGIPEPKWGPLKKYSTENNLNIRTAPDKCFGKRNCYHAKSRLAIYNIDLSKLEF